METIIVFGATGSVGVYTTLHLKKIGYNVIAVGHRKDDNGFFSDHCISYYSIDIAEKGDFKLLPQFGVSQIVHFAGAMPARMEGYDPHKYINSIITGTLNILEYMCGCGCNKIIFAQSIADVLYKFGTTVPIADDSERKFPLATDHSVYSISKNAAVNLIEHYHAQYGFKYFILRLPTIYVYHPNPYYYIDGKKNWMGYRYIIDQAIKGNTLEIWGNPKAKKEMVYVKDFVQIVQKCVESSLEGGVYNVGCGNPISIEDQIRDIANVFAADKKINIVYLPDKVSSPQFTLSIDKAKSELGYYPCYDFHKLLLDFKSEMDNEPFSKLWGKKEDFV
ncbi:NAD-dependent epimerase/dehydratase family protein [Bacteroides eggerthii]|jgi:nucleoside-diphosphate-sugar epimerase|uniref:NAD-dependent epimerase/dehydratase family protein n=1 Tax=Bacteroides eggerthii TaxID=28111 RepID=UPI003564121F